MAELGDFLSSEVKDVNVTIEMLDYAYVGECEDIKKLKAILDVLQSGKEGHYPDLIRYTEERLMSQLPDKEKHKSLLLKAKANPIEVAEAERKLEEWERQIRDTDKSLKATADGGTFTTSKTIFDPEPSTKLTSSRGYLPPVRGSNISAAVQVSSSNPTSTGSATYATVIEAATEERRAGRLSGYDFRAWEKFDVENELQRLEETGNTEAPNRGDESQRKAAERAKEDKRTELHQREMDKILYEMNALSLNEVQRKNRANREKLKGNEYFRVGDNQEAYNCYTRSLALDPTSAVVFSNRSITSIRLERFATAEDDGSRSLALDPKYVKAWLRRGLARFKQGKYAESSMDFIEALRLDPKNAELISMLQKSKEKYEEVEGRSFDEYLTARTATATTGSSAKNKHEVASAGASSASTTTRKNLANVPVSSASSLSELFLPDPSAEVIKSGELRVIEVKGTSSSTNKPITTEEEGGDAPSSAASSGFTRIAIVEESDDEDEKGEDDISEAENKMSSSGFTRIAITEDEDSEEEGEEEVFAEDISKTEQQEDKKEEAVGFTRIAISVEDDEEEEEEEEEKEGKGEEVGEQLKGGSADDTANTVWKDVHSPAPSKSLPKDGASSKPTTTSTIAEDSSPSIPSSSVWRDVSSPEKITPPAASPVASTTGATATASVTTATADVSGKEEEATAPVTSTTSVSTSSKEQANTLKELGNKKYAEGQIQAAVAAYTESLQLDPTLLASLNNRAMAYIKINRHKEAVEDLNQVLSKEATNTKALYRRGLCYNALGQPNQALVDVEALLKVDPSNKQAESLKLDARKKLLLDRAVANRKRGGQALFTALEDLDALLKLDPSDTAAKAERIQTAQLAREFQFSRAVPDKVAADSSKKTSTTTAAANGGGKTGASSAAGGSSGADIGLLQMKESATRRISRSVEEVDPNNLNLPTPPPPAALASSSSSISSLAPQAAVVVAAATAEEASGNSVGINPPLPPIPPSTTVSPVSSTTAPATIAVAAPKSTTTATKSVSVTKRAPAVPTDPPKTLYELERIGRGLKDRPDLLAQYYSHFKKSTYKSVFKEAMSPELLSATLVCLRDSASAPVAASVLEGLASATSFRMIKILLDDSDWCCIDDIIANKLEAAAAVDSKVGSALSRLRSSFSH